MGIAHDFAGEGLVAGDEFVARANPLDQLRTLEIARELTHGQWLGAYDHLTLIREPGYPAWVALVHQAGPSLRLAIGGPAGLRTGPRRRPGA
jgi:hypothetical protein